MNPVLNQSNLFSSRRTVQDWEVVGEDPVVIQSNRKLDIYKLYLDSSGVHPVAPIQGLNIVTFMHQEVIGVVTCHMWVGYFI